MRHRRAVLGALGLLAFGDIAHGETASFDYLIVGAGAAGSVLAARLTENPRINVLVLEAGGPDDDELIYQPAAFRQLVKSRYDWDYETEAEPHLGARQVGWPRGKVWGGSGSISAMVYVRGHPRDFDEWEELGNEGWSFEGVLPYFKKAENQERGPSKYHGVGGPQNVADPRWVPPVSRAFVDAAREAGIPLNEDFNGETQEGAGLYQLNQKNGERHSAAAAYLRPALRRENLTIESPALATRIVFDGHRAVGVSYSKDGRLHEARAEREVILSAGAIGSPQLLMLSGIGPAEHLEAMDISVVRDLPGVGGSLRDHPRVALTYQSKQTLAFDEESAVRDYYLERRGPLSSNGVGAGAFVKVPRDAPLPNVQIFLTVDPVQNTFSLNVALMRPKSQGWIRLRSKNPEDHPLIQANYLAEPQDLERLAAGLAVARRIAEARPLDPYRGEELGPGPRVRGEALDRYIRENLLTFFHAVGTCRMGADRFAVVDDHLRVHGVEGLRVIDASIMPTLISGATHAATVMIAEKGADLIKKDW